MTFTAADLRTLPLFDGLPDEEIDWFLTHGERVSLEPGQRLFGIGEPATALWIVIAGSVEGLEEIGGQRLLVATTGPGEPTGMLPFSRMTHYPRHTVAGEPSEVLKVGAALFPELARVSEEAVRRLVAHMSDPARGDVRLEQQNEKLMALGRLSAGLAHELKNPAAAVSRAATRLAEHRERLPSLVTGLVRHRIGEEGLQRLTDLRSRGAAREELAGLARSEQEEALGARLASLGVEDPWAVAATLADGGVTPEEVEELVEHLPRGVLPDAMAWLGIGIESDRLTREIRDAAGRIADLVASIRTYSHMDRSREHRPTDVREGLDSTLTMLGHKLRQKSIRLSREYADDLPPIPANAGELNQVWTNLLDNAADAVDEGGAVTLRVRHDDDGVQVEIEDDGAGIPPEVLPRIFEPFYTTKDAGEGTGLGLGIARRIVTTHRGQIEALSRPGGTLMRVRLPLR